MVSLSANVAQRGYKSRVHDADDEHHSYYPAPVPGVVGGLKETRNPRGLGPSQGQRPRAVYLYDPKERLTFGLTPSAGVPAQSSTWRTLSHDLPKVFALSLPECGEEGVVALFFS